MRFSRFTDEMTQGGKIKKGFTLMELLIVIGLMLSMFIIGLTSYSNLRMASIDNRTVADVNNIYYQLQTYYQKYGIYPDTLDKLKDDGLISKVPKVANTIFDISYQKGYIFTSEVGQEDGVINTDWHSSFTSSAANGPLKKLTVAEQKDNFYADLSSAGNPTDSCFLLRTDTSVTPAVARPTKTLFRLGAPLLQYRQEAKKDATPCTSRFYDIIVESE